MPMTARQMEKLIMKHGFRWVRSKGSHRQYKNKKGRLVTIPFHSDKDLPTGTQNSILKQAGLK